MGLALVLFGGGGLLGLGLLIYGAIYKKKLLMGVGVVILASIVGLFMFG